jgi:hypothetical protein
VNIPESDVSADQAQMEGLQKELASRASTVHFAHAGVASVAAFIFLCASCKLLWDAYGPRVLHPFWEAHRPLVAQLAAMAAAVSLGLASYAVSRFIRGRKVLRRELERFAEFMALRRRLGVDDPSVLLPQ